MLLGLQILGILFGLIMIYVTFLYFRRKDYDQRGFIVWLLIWIGFIMMAAFPTSVYGLMEALKIKRTVDFFVIGGFLIFSVIIFHTYATTKRNQRQVEILVRRIAMMNNEQRKKSNSSLRKLKKK